MKMEEQNPRDPNGSLPKLGVLFLGVPIMRIIVYRGLYRSPYLGNLPHSPM